MKKLSFCVIIFVLILALPTCTPGKNILNEPEIGSTSTHPGSNRKIIFPIQQLINGERVSLDGLTQGILVASDSCIRLNEDNSDLSFMIIWPPDYNYSIEDEMISVLNGDGTLMAKVGNKVKISGGGVEIFSALPKYIQDQTSSICAPPYWLMGDEIYVIDGESP